MDDLQIIDLRENHFRVSNNIFDNKLSVYELGVYFCLCRFANNDSTESFPSITKLQKMINISRPKVINSLKKLVKLKIIYKRSGYTGKSNRYYLLDIPSKRHLLVNEINQDSKPQLPEVVNEVNPIKTKYKKTNLNKLKEKFEIPISLQTDQFKQSWKEWIVFRKELKKSITPSTANKQLKMLSEQKNPIAVINKSIECGWQGLFPLDKSFKDPPLPTKKLTPLEQALKSWVNVADYDRALKIAIANKIDPDNITSQAELYQLMGTK